MAPVRRDTRGIVDAAELLTPVDFRRVEPAEPLRRPPAATASAVGHRRHWAPPAPHGTSIVLQPPAADPGVTDDERRTVVEMMAKGTYAGILLATADVDSTFERLQACDVEIVQEPTDQPYGVRDCAVRDPAGNLIRIQQVR